MKKIVISLAAALSFAAVSCDSCKSVKELNSETDSLSYAFGVLAGSDVLNGVQRMDPAVDMAQFFKGAKEGLKGDSTKFSYELGYSFALSMKQQMEKMYKQLNLTVDKDVFMAALCAAVEKDSTALMNEMIAQAAWQSILTAADERKMASSPEAIQNKADGEAFLAAKAKEEGIVATPSGLLYKVEKEGKGEAAKMGDKVKVNYKGTLADGTQFDANDNVQMTIGQMVPGFNEALMLMSPGAKYTIYIPSELGYGVRGRGALIPTNSVLVFDVELLEIVK